MRLKSADCYQEYMKVLENTDLQLPVRNNYSMKNQTGKIAAGRLAYGWVFPALIFFLFIANTGFAQPQPPSISSGVTFQWADTQSSNNDPATLESVTVVDGAETFVYDQFAFPIGYELTQLGWNGHAGNNIRLNGVDIIQGSDHPDWNTAALAAFSDPNLNHKFESNTNGRPICLNFNAAATTDAQIQTVVFDDFQIVNRGSIIGITERGANNCYYVELIGSLTQNGPEVLLGNFFVRENDGGFNVYPAPVAPDTAVGDYWWSDRNNANGQVLGIALFRLDQIAPIGSFVSKVRFYGATTDHGDGKFFILRESKTDLGVFKSIDNLEPLTNETVTFTITASNFGPELATGVIVTDTLPSGYTYVGSSASTGSYDHVTGEWNIGSLGYGASETLTITATVMDEGNYTNFATIAGNEEDPNPDNNTSSAAPHFGTGDCPPIDALRVQHAQGDGSESQVATFGSAPAVGNLIVAASFHDGAGTAPTISGVGWSGPIINTKASPNERGMAIWYKVAGANEPSAIATSWGTGENRLLIQEFDIQGAIPSLAAVPFDMVNSGDNTVASISTGVPVPTLTDNTLLVSFLGTRETTGSSPPSWDLGLGDAVGTNGTRSLWSAFYYDDVKGDKQPLITWSTARHANSALFAFDLTPAVPPSRPEMAIVQPTCDVPTGEITITAPLSIFHEYSVDGGATFHDSNIFTTLAGGSYTVVVRDKITGCTNTNQINLFDPSPANCGDCPPVDVVRVQSADGDGAQNQSATFANTPQEGNLIVVASFHRQDGTVPAISGSGWSGPVTDIFAVAGDAYGPFNTSHRRGLAVWYKIAGGSEPTTITTSWDPDSENHLFIQEFEAVNGSFSVAGAVSASANSGGNEVNTLTVGPTGTTASFNTLLMGFFGSRDNPNSVPEWTAADLGISDGTGGARSLYSAFAVVTQQETKSSTATWTNNARRATGILLGIDLIPTPIPDPPVVDVTLPTCFVLTGQIEVTAPLGVDYEYSIDGTNYQIGVLFENLTPATYNVTIQDNETGCVSPPAIVELEPAVCADLEVEKSVLPAAQCVGQEVIFTIIAGNNGPSNATGVVVNDLLPDGYTYVSHSATNGDGSYNPGQDPLNPDHGVWTIGNLIFGASETLTVTATVNASGDYNNIATISGNETDPVSANDEASATVTVHPQPSITITESDATCFGSSTGEIEITVSGGTPNYVFSISDDGGATWTDTPPLPGPTHTFTGLSANTYLVRVMDANGCEAVCP